MKKTKFIIYGILSSLIFFFLFGIVTALIPTDFFRRMSPITILDYVFLILTSMLLGSFISLHYYHKTKNKLCTSSAVTGGIGGFLGFGCSLCNKLLIFILGVAGVLAYIEPYRPLIGFTGIGLMGLALFSKIKDIKKVT